jgi:hypothetical protein
MRAADWIMQNPLEPCDWLERAEHQLLDMAKLFSAD